MMIMTAAVDRLHRRDRVTLAYLREVAAAADEPVPTMTVTAIPVEIWIVTAFVAMVSESRINITRFLRFKQNARKKKL